MSVDFFKRIQGEDKKAYILRLCSHRKKLKMSWAELADIINENCESTYTPDNLRKYNANHCSDYAPALEESDLINFDEARLEMKKLKAKISDERVQLNAYIRQISREETLKDIAVDVAKMMSEKKELPPVQADISKKGLKEGILELSDVHYGAVISNYWNEYNPEIAKKYFARLRDEVIRRCNENDIGVLHVVSLGDLINGLIHLRLRLESRIDVVTQTIQISEILSEFLYSLSERFDVHFYSCLDNHSRLDPNKKDSLDLESMARIIPWYLKTRIQGSVTFHENKYDPEIITFKCNGFNILGVHGDKDKPSTIVEKMSVMTHEHYDLILTAHLHHFSCDEQNETLVISNGSMLATDSFAKNLRLTSRPSQNFIVVDKKNVADCIYRIILA